MGQPLHLSSIPSISIIICWHFLSASMPLLSRAVSDREKATDTVIDGALAVLQSASQIISNVPCAPPGINTVIDCLTKILQTIKVCFALCLSFCHLIFTVFRSTRCG